MIRGLGGIGKSSLAARFAVMFKDAYSDGVFFHNAETWAMLETSIRENVSFKSILCCNVDCTILQISCSIRSICLLTLVGRVSDVPDARPPERKAGVSE